MGNEHKPTNQPQGEKFIDLARQLEADEDEAAFDEKLRRIVKVPDAGGAKVCPECGHVFKGNGWDGIDAHWRSKHEAAMPYAEAWPLVRDGRYGSRR